MSVSAMNHFTILTDNLEATLAFYAEHLGLRPGARPPFRFSGAWLYAQGGSDPILHVVADAPKKVLVPGVIDHMAFTGRGLGEVIGRLDAHGVEYQLRRLPEYGTWQIFFFDPNGAKIEIDFDAAEVAPPGARETPRATA
ncbi:MAG: VOC family protein [Proteobacteria bacterium]|nr:VOC family protein [Pseudomonadota bacterium]